MSGPSLGVRNAKLYGEMHANDTYHVLQLWEAVARTNRNYSDTVCVTDSTVTVTEVTVRVYFCKIVYTVLESSNARELNLLSTARGRPA